MTRVFGFALCVPLVAFFNSAFASQQELLPYGYSVVKEIPIQLTGNPEKENIILAKNASDNQIIVACSTIDGVYRPILQASSALPAISNAYSPSSYDGFEVSVSKGGEGLINVIDSQGEWTELKDSTSSSLDDILLKTKEEGNAQYNYNLLFGYERKTKRVGLHGVYLNINNATCDQSLLATYEVKTVLRLGDPLETFDGAEAFNALKSAYAHVQGDPGKLRKIMPVALDAALKSALDAYKQSNRPKFQELMSGFIAGGAGNACAPSDYIVTKYFFSDRVGWSNDLGFLLEEAGYFSESIELLKQVVVAEPGRVVAYLNLADSYWGNKNIELARSSYLKYQNLMESANKQGKIPGRVIERLK